LRNSSKVSNLSARLDTSSPPGGSARLVAGPGEKSLPGSTKLMPVPASALRWACLRRRLIQVLNNILRNTRDALISVAGERRVMIATAHERPNRVIVIVQDSGPGIDPEIAGDMFEFFRTTKPWGMGLGLALTRIIVEQHGGKMVASSREGARFQIMIPTTQREGQKFDKMSHSPTILGFRPKGSSRGLKNRRRYSRARNPACLH